MITEERYVFWLEDIEFLRSQQILFDRDRALLKMKEDETAEFEAAYPELAATLRAGMKQRELVN